MSSAEAVAILGKSVYEVLHDLVRGEVAAQLLPRRFLSKQALAEHLGVEPRTVKTWRSHGLPGRRVGREVMYDLEEVNRWIERHDG